MTTSNEISRNEKIARNIILFAIGAFLAYAITKMWMTGNEFNL